MTLVQVINMNNFNNILSVLETAIAKGKSNEQLNALMENFSIPEQVTVQQLSRSYAILFPWFLKEQPDYYKDNAGHSLYWKAEKWFFQTLFDNHFEDRKHIQDSLTIAKKHGKSLFEFLNRYTIEEKQPVSDIENKVLQQIYVELGYTTAVQIPYDDFAIPKLLAPYFLWLEKNLKHNAYIHLPIVWKMLHASQHTIRKAFFKWFTALEEKQLVEPHFSINISHAQSLECFLNDSNFINTTTKKDFDQWITLLDHPNPVLRGVAAKCIGSVYTDWQDDDDEFQGHKHIPVTQMLNLLYQKQVEGRNVVGGFIHGCDSDGIKKLEAHKILVAQKFDVKNWVLRTAIDSPETEPYIPGSQAFWFYVHEYLDFDPESVHKLMDGKRYWLAMMCATESLDYGSYEVMQPVLERLIKEAPQDVAKETKRQVTIHLKHK
ncbi:hypothetical protein OAC51_01690 [Flavobacteriaceae bacterium]|nr:hypothetical protein [Flavobacteriaceae bacterium]